MEIDPQNLIACHECDLLQQKVVVPTGGAAKCIRCGAVLYKHKPNSLDRTLAFTIAGVFLFIVANTFPFLAFNMGGNETHATLVSGTKDLYEQGMWGLAILVLLTTVLIPLIQLSGLIYVLLPLKFNRKLWQMPRVFRYLRNLQPWSMMEVFMLGILVSVVKLAGMATIVPGIALWSFAILIFVLAAAAASLDPEIVWERVEMQ